MLHRIFIAINLPEEIKEGLSQLSKNWPTIPCRWLKKETFHLTLAFLGNRSNQELEKVFEAIRQNTEERPSFSFSLNKVSYGPPKIKPPRLVWVEGPANSQLSQLKKNLDQALKQDLGFEPEKKELLPHITLARIKQWDFKRIDWQERPEVNLDVFFEIPVNSLEVMESHLKRTGAEYEVSKSFPLKS